MPLVQHKQEAYWFYRFLSLVYDTYVNPLFWTERMRDQSLALAQLSSPYLRLIDVGSGTGFTTQGIVKHVPGTQVVCLDQSPHQMKRAQAKDDLQGCTFSLGDAENIPCATDRFDRYVSAGSIEYWPDPQQGIREAYRVVKAGGMALVIGPLEPENPLVRFIARTWMLFPREQDYREWFAAAGFVDIQVQYIRPQWYRGREEYGIAIAGVKPKPGPPPDVPSAPSETMAANMTVARRMQLAGRVLVGSFFGLLFIPMALVGHVKSMGYRARSIPPQDREKLNVQQLAALVIMVGILAGLVWMIV